MWIVKLIKPSTDISCYRDDYFPRKFHYKKDAISLKKEVEDKGGTAVVENERKS